MMPTFLCIRRQSSERRGNHEAGSDFCRSTGTAGVTAAGAAGRLVSLCRCRRAQALGIVPDRIMGDFDSLGDVPAGENVEAFSPEKDDTDILLAAKYALSAGCSRLIFYGALGGRLDHMVANLQMLRFLADRHAQGILVDHAHWITLQRGGTASYPRREGMYFSLFAMTERCEDVTLEGVAYPLCHGVFSNAFPLGVSNEILAETAKVTVGKGDLLVMYAKD